MTNMAYNFGGLPVPAFTVGTVVVVIAMVFMVFTMGTIVVVVSASVFTTTFTMMFATMFTVMVLATASLVPVNDHQPF